MYVYFDFKKKRGTKRLFVTSKQFQDTIKIDSVSVKIYPDPGAAMILRAFRWN